MRSRAFTLIEILLAVAMFAVAALIVQAAFKTIMSSLDSARNNAEISRSAESIMWFISSELGNCLLAEGLEFSGSGEDGSDEISFYSTAAYPGYGEKDLFRISYSKKDGDLWKGVDGNYFRAAAGLQKFSVEYYDGKEWFEEWDSNIRGRLPRAASVIFEMGGRSFRKTAVIAVNADAVRAEKEPEL